MSVNISLCKMNNNNLTSLSSAEKLVIKNEVNTWMTKNKNLFVNLSDSKKREKFINIYPGLTKYVEMSYNIWKVEDELSV